MKKKNITKDAVIIREQSSIRVVAINMFALLLAFSAAFSFVFYTPAPGNATGVIVLAHLNLTGAVFLLVLLTWKPKKDYLAEKSEQVKIRFLGDSK